MQIIIDGYKAKLFEINNIKQKEMFLKMISGEFEEEPKRGKGR